MDGQRAMRNVAACKKNRIMIPQTRDRTQWGAIDAYAAAFF